MVSIGYLALHYLHYLTCSVHANLCTPFNVYIDKYQSLSSLHESNLHHNISSEYISEQTQSSCNQSLLDHPCNQLIKLGIVLTETHYSNQWILQYLDQYDTIIVDFEAISVNTMDILNDKYLNLFATHPVICDTQQEEVKHYC